MIKRAQVTLITALLGAGTPGFALAEGGRSFDTTLQPELELTAHLSDQLNVRFGLRDRDAYDSRPGLNANTTATGHMTASALVDWQFAAESLRLTGGAFYGNGRGPALGDGRAATPSPGNNRTTWQSERRLNPYLGLGWDHELGETQRLSLQLDLGLMFDSFAGDTGTGNGATAAENEAFMQERFDSFRSTPMFSAGMRYRF